MAQAVVPHYTDANGRAVPAAAATPMPVTIVEGVGSITWTKTVFALNGSSQTLLAANAARKSLIVANPVGNSQASYDLAGAAVTLANGLALLSGDRDVYTGADCPLTSITVIGTNAQSSYRLRGDLSHGCFLQATGRDPRGQ